jgi:isopentenyl-diphosphate delta-isomerase
MIETNSRELVVLMDADGKRIGTADKAGVHSADTPLHLAFSCHVFDEAGRVLLTRRALSKSTWPGVWTNAFCGHPVPDESFEDAVERRARHELGIGIRELEAILPDFRYRAIDASGIVEHEVCPVFRATIVGELAPCPDEVAEWAWVQPDALRSAVSTAPFAFSPWLVLQLDELKMQ